jgi:hypothetical protein
VSSFRRSRAYCDLYARLASLFFTGPWLAGALVVASETRHFQHTSLLFKLVLCPFHISSVLWTAPRDSYFFAYPSSINQNEKMPSDLAYWLISAPLKNGDPNVLLEDVRRALPGSSVAGWEVPELKVRTHTIFVQLAPARNAARLDTCQHSIGHPLFKLTYPDRHPLLPLDPLGRPPQD